MGIRVEISAEIHISRISESKTEFCFSILLYCILESHSTEGSPLEPNPPFKEFAVNFLFRCILISAYRPDLDPAQTRPMIHVPLKSLRWHKKNNNIWILFFLLTRLTHDIFKITREMPPFRKCWFNLTPSCTKFSDCTVANILETRRYSTTKCNTYPGYPFQLYLKKALRRWGKEHLLRPKEVEKKTNISLKGNLMINISLT